MAPTLRSNAKNLTLCQYVKNSKKRQKKIKIDNDIKKPTIKNGKNSSKKKRQTSSNKMLKKEI